MFKMFCVFLRFFFAHICLPSQNVCVLSQNQLSSDKFFLFTLQLALVHTAPYVYNGATHRVFF